LLATSRVNTYRYFNQEMKMKNRPLSLKLLLSAAIFLPLAQNAYADCAITGATGSGGEIVVCTGVDTDGYTGTGNGDDVSVTAGATVSVTAVNTDAINTANGADVVTVTGGSISSASGDGIEGGPNVDTITINSGSITADDRGIDSGGDADTIIINGGSISGDDGIVGNSGADSITMKEGSVTGVSRGIDGGGDNDTIRIEGGSISGGIRAITGGSGNDRIILAGDSDIFLTVGGDPLRAPINADGGSIDGDEDILSFEMCVPAAELADLQAALRAADPDDGTIVINEKTYTWVKFETIEDDNLTACSGPGPGGATAVPTMSIYGLMLTTLGLLLVATRRLRKSGKRD
jgi:hypothetical protein